MKSIPNRARNISRRIMLEQYLAIKRLKGEKVILPLYSKKEIELSPSRKHAKIVPFIIGQNKPTVIVCPGGAYQFVSYNNEGADYARALNKKGYNVFMLVYRVGIHAHFPAPMEDLARAIAYAKLHAAKYSIDARNIFLCGSSAGGHMCAYFGAKYKDFERPFKGTVYDLRPKGIILAYPLISMFEDTHEISLHTLLGLCDDEEKKRRSAEFLVDKNYPPTFLWCCEGDKTVNPTNSKRFDEALTAQGIYHKFNLYPDGGHGIGLGFKTTARGWMDDAVDFIQSIK